MAPCRCGKVPELLRRILILMARQTQGTKCKLFERVYIISFNILFRRSEKDRWLK
ncbi:hypothetical protein Tmari_1341 [Thermotoga maritima MSB8]|nr:hypothetical protein Tmari_1341 [Thermotoga maritima MSB8]